MEAIMISRISFRLWKCLFPLILLLQNPPSLFSQISLHAVLSEVYGGGGNSGSLYKNDFIELYNPTGIPLTMANWSVQYASASGTFSASNKTIINGTIPAHGFFLVQEAQGSGGSLSLPAPDVTGTVAMAAANGKLALVSDTVTISGPSGASVVDFIGFGTSNQYEGSGAAPAGSNTASIERKAQASSTSETMASGGSDSLQGNGWDSQDNAADILVRPFPDPQNSSSSPEIPPSSFLTILNIARSPFVAEVNGTDTVTADIIGAVVSVARLHVVVNGGTVDSSIMLTPVSGSTYRAIIPVSKHVSAGQLLEYYISVVGSGGEYASSIGTTRGYFVGTSSLQTLKSHDVETVTGYGIRISGAANVKTNLFAQGQGFIQDGSAGVQIFQSGGLPALSEGRNITLRGSVVNYNGAYEISDPGFAVTDTTLGTTTVVPAVVSLPLTEAPSLLAEGSLVKILQVQSAEQGTFSPGNHLFHTPAGDTITVRVESNGSENSILGTSLPAAPVDAVGILSYADGYLRLKPRKAEDVGNVPVMTYEAVASGKWSDTLVWSSHRIPGETDNVSMSTSGVAVTIDLPDARCNNLTMTGSGSVGGPLLRFDTVGSRSLTVNGSVSISGGSGSGQGGRPKLTSNGNPGASLVIKHNIVTTSSNATSSGSAGLNMNEGTVRLIGASVDTLKNGAGLRLGDLQVGDGAAAKILVWAPSKTSTLVIRSLRVRSNASFLVGSGTDTIANDIGNASMSGVATLTGGITVEHGGALVVQHAGLGTTSGSINLNAGGILNNGRIILDTSKTSPVNSRSAYIIKIGGFPVAGASSQVLAGDVPIRCGGIVVGAVDTLTIQNQTCIPDPGTAELAGELRETSGHTIVGTVVATRVANLGAAQTFGGVGCDLTAHDIAPETTTVHRVTGVHCNGEGGAGSILRYFDFSPQVNEGLNASVDIHYDITELAGQDAANLVPWYSPDSGLHWSNEGLHWISDSSLHVLHVSSLGSLHRLTASDIYHPLGNSTVTKLFQMASGWNLVSLPFQSEEQSKKILFPAAISPAFRYIGSYEVADTLEKCVGYWLKFSSDTACELTGFLRASDTISLFEGWNIIGALSQDITTSSIAEDPAGIVVSPFFRYNYGYAVTDTLCASKGYWVKAKTAGKLILSANSISRRSFSSTRFHGSGDEFEVIDNDGIRATLFVEIGDAGAADGRYAELPPVPPEGMFDARFASQRWIESFDGARDSAYAVQIQSSSYPVRIRCTRGTTGFAAAIVDGDGRRHETGPTMPPVVLNHQGTGKLFIVLSHSIDSFEKFSLSANYPNPFNPWTTLTVSLPSGARLEAAVFDMTGAKVKTLDAGVYPKGSHVFTWNGRNDRDEPVPSGLYFVRVTSDKFSAARKVLLVK